MTQQSYQPDDNLDTPQPPESAEQFEQERSAPDEVVTGQAQGGRDDNQTSDPAGGARPARKRGRSRGNAANKSGSTGSAPAEPIDEDEPIQFPVAEETPGSDEAEKSALLELEAKGFTADEALRIIHLSDRIATSRESREAEATLRRLRFTRWLVEQGMLDEYSA